MMILQTNHVIFYNQGTNLEVNVYYKKIISRFTQTTVLTQAANASENTNVETVKASNFIQSSEQIEMPINLNHIASEAEGNEQTQDIREKITASKTEFSNILARVQQAKEDSLKEKKTFTPPKNNEDNDKSSASQPDGMLPTNIPPNETMPSFVTINSDEVSTQVKRIETATEIFVEKTNNLLAEKKVLLARTDEATIRIQDMYQRAETYLRSFVSPGRLAFYMAGTVTLAYTAYSIFRYGQLPFTSLFRGGFAAAAQGASHVVSPVINPTVNPVININYPTSAPLPMTPRNDVFTQYLLEHPLLAIGMGFIFVYKLMKK